MAKRKAKQVEALDEFRVFSLFKNNNVQEILELDYSLIMDHLYEVNKKTTDSHFKLCTKYNYEKYKKNPECILIITDPRIIERNNHSDRLVVPKSFVEKHNINHLPIKVVQVPLTYNLFELPDFK